MQASPDILAIDFGTTNSLVTSANAKEIFPPIPLDKNAEDPTLLRSVSFSPSRGQWAFGQEAMDMYAEHGQQRLFRSIKKFLPDPSFTGTQIHNQYFSIIDLISLFLKFMRERAQNHYQTDIFKVILGRPARFSFQDSQDKLAESRMEAAAKLAGFKEIYFCPEPIAAAYDFYQGLQEEKIVLIADFGGGTSDFTIVRMSAKGFENKDVLGLGGISLAGDAYDGSIMNHKISSHLGANIQFKLPLGSNVLELPRYLVAKLNSPADITFLGRKDVLPTLQKAQRFSVSPTEEKKLTQLLKILEEGLGFALYKNIEQVKKELSSQEKATFKFSYAGEIDLEALVTEAEFSIFSQEVSDKITNTLTDVLNQAQLSPKQIDLLCLTGGTAQIKNLKVKLQDLFGKEKIQQFKFFHSIALGLAKKAQQYVS